MLKTIILNTLLVCYRANRVMPKHLLRKECELQAGGRIGDAEFEEAVAYLAHKKMIDSIEDTLTGDLKFHITDLGRAQL